MASLRAELDEAIDCLTEAEDRCVELAEELERVRTAKQVQFKFYVGPVGVLRLLLLGCALPLRLFRQPSL